MALNEKQAQVLRDLRSVEMPTSLEAGRAENLMRYANPSPAEMAELRTVRSRYRPKVPRSPALPSADAGGLSARDVEDDAVYDAGNRFPQAKSTVLRALVQAGVKPDRIGQALAQFGHDGSSAAAAAEEAAFLRRVTPELFAAPETQQQPPSGTREGTTARRTGTSATEAGLALARELGWSKKTEETSQ